MVEVQHQTIYSHQIKDDHTASTLQRTITAKIESEKYQKLFNPQIILPIEKKKGHPKLPLITLVVRDTIKYATHNVRNEDNIKLSVLDAIYGLIAPHHNLSPPSLTLSGLYVIPEVHRLDDVIATYSRAQNAFQNPDITKLLNCTPTELETQVRRAANNSENPHTREQNRTYYREKMEKLEKYFQE